MISSSHSWSLLWSGYVSFSLWSGKKSPSLTVLCTLIWICCWGCHLQFASSLEETRPVPWTSTVSIQLSMIFSLKNYLHMGGIGGSVRTSLSMQYFPRFFFLYFMVFHIYFFSYTYGIISQYALFQMHVQVCCPQFYVFKAFFSSLLLLPTIAKHVECFSNNCEVAGNL